MSSSPEHGNGPTQALVVLAVSNVARSVKFYSQAFTWRQTVNESVYAEFVVSDHLHVGLYQREAFAVTAGRMPADIPKGRSGGAELYLYEDDLDAATDRLLAAGAELTSNRAMRDWGDEAIYFQDPDGHLLALAKLAIHTPS